MIDLSELLGFNPFGFLDTPLAEYGIAELARTGITLFLIIIFVSWVFVGVIAGLRLITSQGEADKVEGGMTALKNLFIGSVITFAVLIVILMIIEIFTV